MRSTRLLSWIERLLGFEPLPAPPHVFALDPVEIVYARFGLGDQGGRSMATMRRHPLSPDVFAPGPLGGELRNPEALEEAIREVLAPEPIPVEAASLVVPDDWIRLTRLEVQDLPRSREAREEVLRWKLKRTVPVPAEDLRLSVVEPGREGGRDGEPGQILVGFGRDRLLGGIEAAFASRGVQIGRIMNRSSALLPVLGPRSADLWGLVAVADGGYTLAFVHRGEPVLFRSKSLDAGDGDRLRATVLQDLRLTRAFLREQVGGEELDELVLVASESQRQAWTSWLAESFDRHPRVVTRQDLPIPGVDLPLEEAAPLMGAVLQEIR